MQQTDSKYLRIILMCLHLLSRKVDIQQVSKITEDVGDQVMYVIKYCALTLVSLTIELRYVNIKTDKLDRMSGSKSGAGPSFYL
jgi:hypothetical protein